VRWIGFVLILAALLVFARSIAWLVLEYQWWGELEQRETWFAMLLYRLSPVIVASLMAFVVLWLAHQRALRFARVYRVQNRWYGRTVAAVCLGVAVLVASLTTDTWTVVRFFGGQGLPSDAGAWRDPVFGHTVGFYLFALPFLKMLRSYLLALTLVAILAYWITARGWQIRQQLAFLRDLEEFDTRIFRLEGGLESRFLRGAVAVLLLGLGFRSVLQRYALLYKDHGFMVGIDWVDEHVTLPLLWLVAAACVAAAVLMWLGRWLWAASLTAAALIISAVVPVAVTAIYVRPNENRIQRPYIETHIHATRAAYGLSRRAREIEFAAQLEADINPSDYPALFDNVRLWDWRAFHDTITQIQALRPYYVFRDSDVDRYVIDGKLRQVMLSPRELDIRQLPDAQVRWINPHFIYTHGYGMVMAEANRITPEGLPVLFIQDAPPVVKTASLRLTRPELYYGEVTHEPVFVRTAQQEFSYPAGNENVFTRYEGRGGFPVSSLPLRLAAAVAYGDVNILLTQYLTAESRMMIRRNIRERLETLAGFIHWDPDPYLVLADDGRLFWFVDGYTTSNAHPYSQPLRLEQLGTLNYIRNPVKATIDAYNGTVHIYVFDPDDPIIRAYQRLFPKLLEPASQMPADLRRHARYPETYFRVQAEIYRTYHMLDPLAFYNKEDVWDIARNIYGQESRPQQVSPTYVVATIPGEEQAEFLLMLPFTPRNKDNLIGLMVARCDGEHLGELLFLQLSKQELFFGTMQIEARINQDQVISKDLSLWNQQGSQVLRGMMLVLPVDNTLVYVEPIYIQASEARMPQLKKVVLALGNRLIYEDTYEQALARLAEGRAQPASRPEASPASSTPSQPSAQPQTAAPVQILQQIREHLRRYRELAAQGRWAEAGRELEAIDQLVNR